MYIQIKCLLKKNCFSGVKANYIAAIQPIPKGLRLFVIIW